ncbi:hypothetical protein [Skermanella pratensis]|uniref:hypothetical protein n=1 Tax=Skermanella pratensis TaxID=2233999 RepID=UPI00178893E5|nr:hypothetical protein [Skermanella pratensis]
MFADAVAVVQGLDIVLEIQSATFKKANAKIMPQQFHCQGNSGSTGANDTDIGFD